MKDQESMVKNIRKELKKYANLERKKVNKYFFKTGKGQYGEGDVFIGVRVPDIRKIVKRFKDVGLGEIKELLYSQVHEERLLALLMLVEKNNKAIKREDKKIQIKIVKFYLQHQKQANNWDLVDLSTHYILGQAILNGLESEEVLINMTQSNNLWTRRMSIVSTWIIIRTGNIELTLYLSKKLLKDKEDLMHKAVGWMLREAWKKDEQKVEEFLIKNYQQLPRTTLRYAIERMEESKRLVFLKGEFE